MTRTAQHPSNEGAGGDAGWAASWRLPRGVQLAAFLLSLAMGAATSGQTAPSPGGAAAAPAPQPFNGVNPLTLLNPLEGLLQSAGGDREPASGPRGLSASLSILVLLTVLTIAPSLLVMTTSFTRIIIVLALLRQAIGTQSLPPSQIIVGLALFMSFLVMAPTFEQINAEAIAPLNEGHIEQIEAWSRAKEPLKRFMLAQIEHAENWADVFMILKYRYGPEKVADPGSLTEADVDMLTLIPAFVLSELKVAFLIGFRLYLPFLIIDMVVASVLISMGMLMLPPVLISLPFKLLLFVLVDGWHLVVGNLLSSFVV